MKNIGNNEETIKKVRKVCVFRKKKSCKGLNPLHYLTHT